MLLKTSIRWSILSAALGGLILSAALLSFLIPTPDGPIAQVKSASFVSNQASQKLVDGPAVTDTQKNAPAERAHSDLSMQLSIPRIGIDAGVEPIGLTPDGAMGTPKNPANAAWFERGPRPGEIGSAVIDGHFGWKNGTAAVFDNLHQLQVGDTFSVTENGIATRFVVRKLQTLGENDDAASVFLSHDGKAHLNLITCEGVWNKAHASYSNRLVVFSDAE